MFGYIFDNNHSGFILLTTIHLQSQPNKPPVKESHDSLSRLLFKELISFRFHGTNSCFVNKFVFCIAVDVFIDMMETNMPGLKLNAAFVRMPSPTGL